MSSRRKSTLQDKTELRLDFRTLFEQKTWGGRPLLKKEKKEKRKVNGFAQGHILHMRLMLF